MWPPANGSAMLPETTVEALTLLAARQRGPRRHAQPVGVIGPGDGGVRECQAAYAVGRHLAAAGMAIVCGGRGGVMAAASRGAHDAGGIVIGLLPEDDDRHANEWLSVAVPTGMGEMRNALIARSSRCLVAVGGGMGTLSEMALGLKWGKPVYVLHGDIALPGAVPAADLGELLGAVAACLLD